MTVPVEIPGAVVTVLLSALLAAIRSNGELRGRVDMLSTILLRDRRVQHRAAAQADSKTLKTMLPALMEKR